MVIHGFWDGVKPVGLGRSAMQTHGVVGCVTHCLRHCAESRGRLNPSHGASHGDANQLGLPRALWWDDAKPQAVLGAQEQSVESVFDVVFARAHRAKPRVGVADLVQCSIQGVSKLHGLGRRMRFCHFVDGRPSKGP